MLKTKTMDRAACVLCAVMLAAAALLWGLVEPVRGDGSHTVGYENLLFDSSRAHTIDITMDGWDSFIANAAAEEYTDCSITVDGETYSHVAIRCKGNTSLSSVATLNSTRYSFKVEFNHFTSGMTYHGLDKLSLNNLIQDATMMKDYLAYTLMNRMGVPSSLCSYAQITVNGEPWGLYLAVEGVEDGFMDRNGLTKGELYKPDSMSFGGGRGNGGGFDFEKFRVDETETDGETTQKTESPAAPADSGETAGTETAASGGFTMPEGMTAPGGNGTMPQMPEGMSLPEGMSFPEGMTPPDEMNSFPARTADSSSGTERPEFPGNGNFQFDFGGGAGMFNFGMGSEDVKLIYSDDDPESYSNIFNNAKTKIKTRDKTRLIESLRKLNAKEDIESVVNTDEVINYLAVHSFLCNDDSYTGMMVHNYYLYEENGRLSILPWDYNLAFGGFSASSDATSTVNSPIDSPVTGGTTDSRPLIAWIFSDEEALAKYHEVYDRFIRENIESGWLAAEIARVQALITPYVEKDPSAFYTADEFNKAVETLQTFCAKRGESIRGQLEGTIPSTSDGQRSSNALIDASDISTSDMGSMNRGGEQGGGPGGGGFTKPEGMNMPDMSSIPGGNGFTKPEGMGEQPAAPERPEGGGPSGQPGKMPEGMNFPGMGLQNQSEKWILAGISGAVLLAAFLVIRFFRGHNA